jgi:hypothetical protein
MVAFVSLLLVAASASAADLSTILDGLCPRNGIREIGTEDLTRLLEYGIEHELMIFELFNEAAVHLMRTGSRAHIDGQTLRDLDRLYDLGGDRVYSLLPVSKIADVYIGGAVLEGDAPLEVLLTGEHESQLENESTKVLNKMRILLSERYGFASITPGSFLDGFGAGVRLSLFRFALESVEIYEKNKIAIRTDGFSRPKRWRIGRMKRLF